MDSCDSELLLLARRLIRIHKPFEEEKHKAVLVHEEFFFYVSRFYYYFLKYIVGFLLQLTASDKKKVNKHYEV